MYDIYRFVFDLLMDGGGSEERHFFFLTKLANGTKFHRVEIPELTENTILYRMWFAQNIKGYSYTKMDVHYSNGQTHVANTVWFQNPDDAMIFKLRWGDAKPE